MLQAELTENPLRLTHNQEKDLSSKSGTNSSISRHNCLMSVFLSLNCGQSNELRFTATGTVA